MANLKRKKPKPVGELTSAELTQLVVDFVRRLRRVALHPLVSGDPNELPGHLLQEFMSIPMTISMPVEGQGTLSAPTPDEVLFESLAVRVRAFTLSDDRLHYARALNALGRMTGYDDEKFKAAYKKLRSMWVESTDRPKEPGKLVRGFFAESEDGRLFSDIDLAWAWLYEDSVHGDEATTSPFGVGFKFAAAVGVFSHIAFVALHTLHFINGLCEVGIIELPVGTFSDSVIATGNKWTMRVTNVVETEVDADLTDLGPAGPLPGYARPTAEVIADFNATRGWLQ